MAKHEHHESYGDVQRRVYGVAPTNYMQKRAAESLREHTVARITRLADRAARAIEAGQRRAINALKRAVKR